jgi:hypothetical protein
VSQPRSVLAPNANEKGRNRVVFTVIDVIMIIIGVLSLMISALGVYAAWKYRR